MTFTLLLDLDDTLLDTNLNTFIQKYFQALAGALAPHVAPESMLPALIGGTKKMMANQDPAHTLREVFDAYFFPKIGIAQARLQPEFDKFYEEAFPALQPLTRPRPAAVELVEWACAQGWRVAIATNPLFPLSAIQQRLRWAELPPEKYPFVLVTSYETSHFAKSPAYYAEVMTRLGWPDDPVLMVGDEPDWDVAAARAAGMRAFQVRRDGVLRSEPPADGEGDIAEVRTWLAAQDAATFHMNFEKPEALLAALLGVPAGLACLLENVPAERWSRCPNSDEWSLNEVVCHLRDVDLDVNLPRIRTLLNETYPFIAAQVTDDWVAQRAYDRQDGRLALQDWIAARAKLVNTLHSLALEDWKRMGRHAIFGPTSLQELIAFTSQHDRNHVQQVMKTIGQIREDSPVK
jgi:FMN phosphatase YigB (HAD superfamily)